LLLHDGLSYGWGKLLTDQLALVDVPNKEVMLNIENVLSVTDVHIDVVLIKVLEEIIGIVPEDLLRDLSKDNEPRNNRAALRQILRDKPVAWFA